MSPASQGGVEVERYIGSCLISSSVRAGSHKPKQEAVIRGKTRGCYAGQIFPNGVEQCQVQYGPGGWTGAPLISMTSSPRRCNQRSSPPLGQQQGQSPPPQSCDQQSAHLHKNPLSRLAIHTQGAPLILASRFHNRGRLHNSGNINGVVSPGCSNAGATNSYVHGATNCGPMSNALRCPPARSPRSAELAKKQQPIGKSPDCPSPKENVNANGNSIANIDSLSIASDESSGSNNSENSLPRIIKPRKRRKKDRKPGNNVAAPAEVAKHEEQQSGSCGPTEPSSAASLKPYTPASYEAAVPAQLRNHRRPPMPRESSYGCRSQATELADARQRYPHRHVEVKVLDDNGNVVAAQMRGPAKGYRHEQHRHTAAGNLPRYLHADYTDPTVTGCENSVADGFGTCQCRYCDPSALMWDVDRGNCCSLYYLTQSPSADLCPARYTQIPPMYLSSPEQGSQRLFTTDHPRSRREKDGGVVLRRSWSDPSSYFSEEITAPSKDVGVIGDRGQAETGKRRTLWRGESIGIPTSNVVPTCSDAIGIEHASKGLEVSTEIITSPNGHRDLEIKFYSSSPNAATAEEVDEDEEDFSDIWSYHESKLQQDFRTLLQAEE